MDPAREKYKIKIKKKKKEKDKVKDETNMKYLLSPLNILHVHMKPILEKKKKKM